MQRIKDIIKVWFFKKELAELALAREEVARERSDISVAVDGRIADFLFKMDPFEPLLRKYNLVFSEEYEHIEDKLDSPSQLRLFMWAYGVRDDLSFKYMVDWIRNNQGTLTVRKAAGDEQWFFGRAMVSSITLIIEEISRLASRYEEILAKKDVSFDQYLPVSEE